MKASLILVFLFASLLLVPQALGAEGAIWVSGQVIGTPDQQQYVVAYHVWNFTVTDSNSTELTALPRNITCVFPIVFGNDPFSNIESGQSLNLTGQFTSQPPTQNGVPAGFFLVNARVDDGASDDSWLATLKMLFDTVSGVGKLVVTLIIQVIAAFIGFQAPEWAVTLGVVAFVAVTFLKFFKRLPWIILLVFFFISVAVISNLIGSLAL